MYACHSAVLIGFGFSGLSLFGGDDLTDNFQVLQCLGWARWFGFKLDAADGYPEPSHSECRSGLRHAASACRRVPAHTGACQRIPAPSLSLTGRRPLFLAASRPAILEVLSNVIGSYYV